jgi:hypothetical protein
MHRVSWKKSAARREGKRGGPNISNRNPVRQVHDVRLWRDARDNSFHGAHKPVIDSEVRQHCDGSHFGGLILIEFR